MPMLAKKARLQGQDSHSCCGESMSQLISVIDVLVTAMGIQEQKRL